MKVDLGVEPAAEIKGQIRQRLHVYSPNTRSMALYDVTAIKSRGRVQARDLWGTKAGGDSRILFG
jgi:hypothetical protein